MKLRKVMVWTLAVIVLLGTAVFASFHADAKGFRSSPSRSYSKSYAKPKPVTKVQKKTVVVNKKTTIVQNNSTATSSGMGSQILGNAIGTAGGVVAGNAISDWLRKPDEQPVEQPQVPLVEPTKVIPTEPVNMAPTCPMNFICDFENGRFYDIENQRLIDYRRNLQ